MKIHSDVPSEDVQIQLIPLIDVIFCILTFFILAALQFTRQQAIRIDLPRANTGTSLSVPGLGNNRFREMLVVTIAPTGQLFLDKTPVSQANLAQELQTYLQQNPNGMLVLNASPNIFYNNVIQVIDVMRSVGGNRVALATLPTTAPQLPNADPTSPAPGLDPLAPTTPFPSLDPFGTTPGNGLSTPTPLPSETVPGGLGTEDSQPTSP